MNFIKKLLSKRSCAKRELLQLLGHMNFASRVILAGRAFVSYLLALASSVSELHYYVHLNSECRQDLHMWMEFLSNWNGVSLFYGGDFTSSFDIQLHTDAASTAGFSVVYKTHWISKKWPAEMPSIPDNLASMAFMELYPIVVAAYIFGREWQQKKIMFVCDNQSVNSILRKSRSCCPHIMKLMRTLTWLALTNNFYFSSSYIKSKKNVYADLLSRLQVEKFKKLRPDADPQPTPCPSPDNLLWNYKVQWTIFLSTLSVSLQERLMILDLKTFIQFLLLQGLAFDCSKLPVISENILVDFVAYCFDQLKLKFATIKLYLCDLRYGYMIQRVTSPFDNMPLQRLYAALLGIKRIQGSHQSPKMPITSDILFKLCQCLDGGYFDNFTNTLMKAVLLLAYFGFFYAAVNSLSLILFNMMWIWLLMMSDYMMTVYLSIWNSPRQTHFVKVSQ